VWHKGGTAKESGEDERQAGVAVLLFSFFFVTILHIFLFNNEATIENVN